MLKTFSPGIVISAILVRWILLLSFVTNQVHIQLEPDSNKKKKNLDVWTTGSKISKQGLTPNCCTAEIGYDVSSIVWEIYF